MMNGMRIKNNTTQKIGNRQAATWRSSNRCSGYPGRRATADTGLICEPCGILNQIILCQRICRVSTLKYRRSKKVLYEQDRSRWRCHLCQMLPPLADRKDGLSQKRKSYCDKG